MKTFQTSFIMLLFLLFGSFIGKLALDSNDVKAEPVLVNAPSSNALELPLGITIKPNGKVNVTNALNRTVSVQVMSKSRVVTRYRYKYRYRTIYKNLDTTVIRRLMHRYDSIDKNNTEGIITDSI